MGGDLNDIKNRFEKSGGNQKSKRSFQQFRECIQGIQMAEIRFIDRQWTWANNRMGEDFVEERLDDSLLPQIGWSNIPMRWFLIFRSKLLITVCYFWILIMEGRKLLRGSILIKGTWTFRILNR